LPERHQWKPAVQTAAVMPAGRPALLRQSGLRASTGGVLATKKRTQNVSEYMLVLALCLVVFAFAH